MKKKSHFFPPFPEGLTKLLTLMKFSFVLLTVCTLSISAAVFPQAKNLTLELKNVTIRQAFDEIEKQSGFKFFYIDEQVDVTKKVDVVVNNKNIEEVLQSIFDNSQIKYKIFENNLVVLSPNLESNAQQVKVSGKVTDSQTGEPLPGVNVLVQGTTIGVTTDMDGKYFIELPNAEATIVFSYIGYMSETVKYAGQANVDMQLVPDITKLDEVVVVGYGSSRKSDVTGSITRVSAKDIAQMPVQNTIQAMQGRAAGVDITSATYNRPGEMGSITIRGNRSINGSNSPLYVVDGIPLEAGGIEAFNPQDIESIDILKDASATAIYGSRGANGVILITTKKGTTGKTTINYTSSLTFDKINDLSENFDSPEYIAYRREAYRGRSVSGSTYNPDNPSEATDRAIFGSDPYAWLTIAKAWEGGSYAPSKLTTTNWTDYVTRTGVTQDHTLSVSGGNDKTHAYLSLGYLDQKGTNKDQSYKRYNLQASMDIKPSENFTFGGSITGTRSKQDYGYLYSGTGAKFLYDLAKAQYPYAVPYDTLGRYIYNPGGEIAVVNPINEAENAVNERINTRVLVNLFAELKFTNWLKYRCNFGPDIRNYRLGQFQKGLSQLRGGLSTSSNYANYETQSIFAYTLENLLYINQSFSDMHKIGVTLLHSMSYNFMEKSNLASTNMPVDDQLWYGMEQTRTSDGKPTAFGTSYEKKQLMSYMGRVNYSLMDKYSLTASARWDGSSQLAEGHQWDYFTSFALAWKLNQEEFVKNISFINLLKLRIGYGSTGNSALSIYGNLGDLMPLNYRWGTTTVTGFLPSRPNESTPSPMPNPILGWEKTNQLNCGLDFGLFERISGSVDYYIAQTSDVLMKRSTPSTLGYTNTWANIGRTKNSGVEVQLNTINIVSNGFKWTTDWTFSTNKEQIIETAYGKQDDISNSWFINEPIGVYYDYEDAGIWQYSDSLLMRAYNTKAGSAIYSPGSIRVNDLNNDTIIDANNDRKIRGQRSPKWTAGLLNTFTYKGWDLSVFIYARWGQTIRGANPDFQARYPSRKVNYWTPTNPSNEYPRPNYGNASPLYATSLLYEDGSFIKVKNISLGYTFPKEWMGKLKISNFRLYAMLLNPFLYTKNGYIDPDFSVSSNVNYPSTSVSSKSYVVGLSVSF